MKLRIIVILLALFSTKSYSRDLDSLSDVFPLRIGSSWIYQYYSYSYQFDGVETYYNVTDSGIVRYHIIDSVRNGDTLSWNFTLERNILQISYSTFIPVIYDTAFYKDTLHQSLREVLSGEHRLIQEVDSIGVVWLFPASGCDSNAIYRYHIVDSSGQAKESLWPCHHPWTDFIFKPDSGLMQRSYFMALPDNGSSLNCNLLATHNVQIESSYVVYPLHIGDAWSYGSSFNNLSEMRRIVGDTIMPNGKHYFIEQDSGAFVGLSPQYVRQAKSRVYSYNPYSTDSESIQYDFSKSPGDTVNSPGILIFNGKFTDTVFGKTRNIYEFVAYSSSNFLLYVQHVADGIGLIYKIGEVMPPFQIQGAIINGVKYGAITSIQMTNDKLPRTFFLSQNYPNPFNPTTSLLYELPERSLVTIKVFNILGEQKAVIVITEQNAGSYSVSFDGSSLPSGIYFYRMSALSTKRTFVEVKKMVLLK